jgi:pSer/pThr/pTyr-binding forkhead associated (FHA) protein
MALLEVFSTSGQGSRKVDLDVLPTGETGFADYIMGRSPEVWLSLPDDANVSRLHAKLSPIAGRWALEDLGARNGTWVNGERLVGMHVLHHGDEIRMGATSVVFRDPTLDKDSTTVPKGPRPHLTDRERDVLVELCRPIFSANLVKKAASRKQIATTLFISDAAVQAHLTSLYRKLLIFDETPDKRDTLAIAVIEAGIISPSDYGHDNRDDTTG